MKTKMIIIGSIVLLAIGVIVAHHMTGNCPLNCAKSAAAKK